MLIEFRTLEVTKDATRIPDCLSVWLTFPPPPQIKVINCLFFSISISVDDLFTLVDRIQTVVNSSFWVFAMSINNETVS